MQIMTAKIPNMNSESFMAFSHWSRAENASYMLLFPVLARRGPTDRGQHRQAAGAGAENLIPAINPQTGHIKNTDSSHSGSDKN